MSAKHKVHKAIALMLVVSACTSEQTVTPDPAPGATRKTSEETFPVPSRPALIPTVDTNQHSVPLDQIYFDTFDPANRAVPLDQATPELIERLIDAIPPIHAPNYEPASAADWLNDEDTIVGYAIGKQAWAYPVRILNFHEIVNETLGGEPVLISYCPLCFSGIVYSRRLGDQVLTFGNTSALYESDMVMLDYETGSYWWQVPGQAIVGPLTGEELELLPSTVTTWRSWRELHPDTRVLSRDTGYDRNYNQDPFATYAEILEGGRFAFPVGEAARDPRLSPAAIVLALKVEGTVVAYPLERSAPSVIHDEVGGSPVAVFLDPGSQSGAAFHPIVAGELLRFRWTEAGPIDENTGSLWDLAGRAIDGPLIGEQLKPLPTKTSFWFAIVAAEPDIEVRNGE
ncbi:MAG: DUF3179 domain-containing protein [Anaerolineales bacterium]